MKQIYAYLAGIITVSFGLAACIPGPAPEPTPDPVQEAPPAQISPPPPPAVAENWIDTPQSAGDWLYAEEPAETFALFGTGGENVSAIIRCDKTTRELGIGVFGTAVPETATIRVLTETAERTLRATRRSSSAPLVAAELSPNDPLFDAIALTRGRFVLAASGQTPLYLPAWGEVTRVIEDCR
jgi:hypothetical protein